MLGIALYLSPSPAISYYTNIIRTIPYQLSSSAGAFLFCSERHSLISLLWQQLTHYFSHLVGLFRVSNLQSYKFCDKVQLDSIVFNELGDYRELLKPDPTADDQVERGAVSCMSSVYILYVCLCLSLYM